MVKGRKFAAFDIDGTLIRWQLYHAVADTLAKSGHTDPETYGQIRDARMIWKRRQHPESFKDYERQLIGVYESILKTLTSKQFAQAAQDVFDEYKDQVYTYTRDLIKDLKKQKYLLFAISGSQVEIVKKIAAYYGFDDCVGTIYHQQAGRFTGEKTIASFDKAGILDSLIKKYRAQMDGSLAVGDSLSDVPMMEMVEHPIVFNPEKKLFDYAKKQSWKVVVERKNVVYELEKKSGKYQLVKAS